MSVWLALVGATVVLAPAINASAPGCVFRRATGVPCPTCGTTRAVLAAMAGRVADAFAFNPLIFALAVLGAILLALRIALARRVVIDGSPAVLVPAAGCKNWQ